MAACSKLPPVASLSSSLFVIEESRGECDIARGAAAEAPELLRRLLVLVHNVVELEHIDVAWDEVVASDASRGSQGSRSDRHRSVELVSVTDPLAALAPM